MNYLAQPAQAPSGQEPIYKELGLNTNRDIVEKGPEYANNLNQSADANEKDAKALDTMAKQADAASAQMKNFADTLDKRNTNIQSVADQTAVTANRKDSSTDPNAITATQGGAQGTGTGADGTTGQIGFGLDPLGGKDSSMTGGKLGANGKSGSGADGATSPGGKSGGRSPSSLAEQLRASLDSKHEIGSGKDGAAGAEPRSAFDGIFSADDKNSTGKDGKSGISAEGSGGRMASAAHGFSLAGSDTDRAVNKLLGNLNGQGSDAEIYGNVDQSIFVRMKKYLTKAQVDKKIGEK